MSIKEKSEAEYQKKKLPIVRARVVKLAKEMKIKELIERWINDTLSLEEAKELRSRLEIQLNIAQRKTPRNNQLIGDLAILLAALDIRIERM